MSLASPGRWLEWEDAGGATVVRLKTPKTLDEDTVRVLFDTLEGLVGGVRGKRLVLDLSDVESLGSLALCKLVMLNKRVRAADGSLALYHLSPGVTAILEGTLLTRFFDIQRREHEAPQFAGQN